MLAFARAMGEFGATLMIAGNIPGRTQTISIAIYEAGEAGDDALANGLVFVASAVCVGLLVAASVVLRRGHLKVEPLVAMRLRRRHRQDGHCARSHGSISRSQFRVDADRLALFGPSGAGKSLTLQMLAGLVRPDRGQIVVDDEVWLDRTRKL